MPLAAQLILFTSLWFFSTAIFTLWFSSAVWQWTFQCNWLAWRSLSPPTRSKSTSLCSPQPLPTSPCWPCWLYSQLASFQIQLLLILVVGVEQLWDLLFKVGEIPVPSSRPSPATFWQSIDDHLLPHDLFLGLLLLIENWIRPLKSANISHPEWICVIMNLTWNSLPGWALALSIVLLHPLCSNPAVLAPPHFYSSRLFAFSHESLLDHWHFPRDELGVS